MSCIHRRFWTQCRRCRHDLARVLVFTLATVFAVVAIVGWCATELLDVR